MRVSVVACLFVIVTGIPLAYLLSRWRKRKKWEWLRAFLEFLILLPLALPPTVIGYMLLVVFQSPGLFGTLYFKVFGESLIFSWQAAVVASSVVAFPLFVRVARGAFDAVADEAKDVAYTLGYSKFQTLYKVQLRLAGRGLAAGAVLAFCRCLGEFGATLLFAGNIPGETTTLSLAVYSASAAGQWEEAHALVWCMVLLSLGFVVIAAFMERKSGKA
jgi:molybdate transport system permease protein